jgi:hypothetical protein
MKAKKQSRLIDDVVFFGVMLLVAHAALSFLVVGEGGSLR